MRIAKNASHLRVVKEPTVKAALSGMWSDLARTINGRLNFGSPQDTSKKESGNLDGVWPGTISGQYTGTTPGGINTEFTVTHNLGRIPIGYDVKSKDKPGQIYDSRKNAWTITQMFLKSDTATMQYVLFVH